jgi:hypothetical protein
MAYKPPRTPRPQWTQAAPKRQTTPPNYNNWQGRTIRDIGEQYAGPYAGGYYRPPVQPRPAAPRTFDPATHRAGIVQPYANQSSGWQPNVRPPEPQVPYYGSQAHIEAWKEQYLNAFHPAYGPQYYVNAPLPSAPAPKQEQSAGGGGGYYGGGYGGGWGGGGGGGGYSNTARDVAAWARLVSWNVNR